MSVPKLRFKEFDEDWDLKNLGDCFRLFSGYSFPSSASVDNGIKWLKIADVGIQEMTPNNLSFLPNDFKVKFSQFIVSKNDYVIALTRPILNQKLKISKVGEFYDGALLNQRVAKIVSENNNLDFIYSLLQKSKTVEELENSIAGTDPPNLSLNEVKGIVLGIPKVQEQTKIASFISAVDEKINQLTQKHELLSQYKQGMMQKLFSQQIRFKADDGNEFGEWEEKPLNHYLYTSKLKNKDLKFSKQEVLSVSGELGVVNQIELLGRSYAGVSVAPYGVVEHGDIVYTKSPLKSSPYGIIKANKGKPGIVSTLYAIYKCKKNVSPNLVDYYFQNDLKLNHFLKPLVKKGAKNDMKVNNDHVLTGLVLFPSSMEEQTKIANFLSAIDQKIEVVAQQIEQAKQWKKGLLQQMFV